MILGCFNFSSKKAKIAMGLSNGDVKHAMLSYYKKYEPDIYYQIVAELVFNKEFKIVVDNMNDLVGYMEFFNKFDSDDNYLVSFRSTNISNLDIYNFVKKYCNTSFSEKVYFYLEDGTEKVSFNDFIQMMDIFNKTINRCSEELSPLEKIFIIYNDIKYRKYQYDENNPDIARKLCSSTINEHRDIVCQGYVKEFNELLRINGIKCMEYKFYGYTKDGTEYVAHCASIVNLCDPKYGLDGIYIFDITEDSLLEEKDEVYNRTQLKGFLLSYDEYKGKYNILLDNFHLFLLCSDSVLDNAVARLEEDAKTRFVSVYDNYKNYMVICDYIFIDYALMNGASTIDYEPNVILQEANTIKFAKELKTKLGSPIPSTDDLLIDLLLNTNFSNNSDAYLLKYLFSRNVLDEEKSPLTLKLIEKSKERK